MGLSKGDKGKAKGAGDTAALSAASAGVLADQEQAAMPQLDPEIAAKIASLRSHVRESFGKVVMAMMMLPRYRQQTLADLQHLVLEPLIRDRVAIAQKASDIALAEDVAGIAIWASLSDEAEERLRDQIRGNMWPLRLRAEDWNSGSNNWLIDVIAPDRKATASVIANFKQVVKEGSLRLHPQVTQLLDAETLEKMGARRDAPAAGATAAANAEGSAAVN